MTRFEERLKQFEALSEEDRLALAVELLRRPARERTDQAERLFRKKYPAAPSEMAQAGAFHAYMDLPTAMRDLLAWLQTCLRDDDYEQDVGLCFHVLYHVYNWLQIESLIPHGREGVLEELQEVKACLQKDDKQGAEGYLDVLIEQFKGDVAPPEI